MYVNNFFSILESCTMYYPLENIVSLFQGNTMILAQTKS